MRAESYLATDPVGACFYARRVAEEMVGQLYDLRQLPAPYQGDLAARTNAAAFKTVPGNGINQKPNVIRRIGTQAAHPEGRTPIRPDVAAQDRENAEKATELRLTQSTEV